LQITASLPLNRHEIASSQRSPQRRSSSRRRDMHGRDGASLDDRLDRRDPFRAHEIGQRDGIMLASLASAQQAERGGLEPRLVDQTASTDGGGSGMTSSVIPRRRNAERKREAFRAPQTPR